MNEFYSPNFALNSNWKSSSTVLTTQLRNQKLATKDTFKWEDFKFTEWQLGTMTMSGFRVYAARYCRIGRLFCLNFDIQFTIGGVASNVIDFRMPFTGAGEVSPVYTFQVGTLITVSAAPAFEVGTIFIYGPRSFISMARFNLANFPLATCRFLGSGTFEITDE
jgi:hypothetical protein